MILLSGNRRWEETFQGKRQHTANGFAKGFRVFDSVGEDQRHPDMTPGGPDGPVPQLPRYDVHKF